MDVELKLDLSRDNKLLFKSCSKCNARMLKGVLDTHERFCHGETARQVYRSTSQISALSCQSFISNSDDAPIDLSNITVERGRGGRCFRTFKVVLKTRENLTLMVETKLQKTELSHKRTSKTDFDKGWRSHQAKHVGSMS